MLRVCLFVMVFSMKYATSNYTPILSLIRMEKTESLAFFTFGTKCQFTFTDKMLTEVKYELPT